MSTENFDLIVIGAGPGGYVGAIRAAQLGMSVACIEKHASLGGTCLNVGCIPSKALLHASEHYAGAASGHLASMGVAIGAVKLDLPAMMKSKSDIVSGLTTGIDFLFTKNKITRLEGTARIDGSGAVTIVDGKDKGSYRAFSVEDGLQFGANAVMNMCYPHHREEDRIFRECASLVSECSETGIPVILESLPYGIGYPDQYTPENISFAARIAAEIGADVVKTAFPTGGSVDEFKGIIDSCMVPVVVLGGAAMGDDRALFQMVRDSMDAGASGVAVGRNVWQHNSPVGVARCLNAIVHEDVSVGGALKLLEEHS